MGAAQRHWVNSRKFNRKHLAKRRGFAILTAVIGLIRLYDRISLEYRNKIAIELLSISGSLMLKLVKQSQNH